ncbi:MAG: hypothetical protein K0R50_1251 [Eubacterium sp.]|jgi:hypothetical protein|nr:hypothetical protein [Eubacterium sp.]
MAKHYIRLDLNNNIVKGFSDDFEEPSDTDICINEKGERHFEINGKINPVLFENGIYKFKWEDGHVTLQAVSKTIEQQKAAKIAELDQECTKSILNGYYSDADGEMKFYGFNWQDQSNMNASMNGINAGLRTTVSWKEKGGFPKEYSAEQFKKLYEDGFGNHLEGKWIRFHQLKAQILSCEDDTWKDIVWSV